MNQTVEANSGQDEIEPIRPELSEPSRMSAFWTPDDACVPSHRLETRTWDLFAALAWAERPDPLSRLRDALQAQTSRQRILFAPSGRCAIARILSLLPQQEVVMPAFLCHEVRKAAEIAGKRIIYVDTAKNGINATSAEFAEAAKPGRVLLAVHALGIPTDIESICELARRRDCVVIEDAAAAFGGRRNGRVLGTFGNIGIFSFERSKRFAAFRGAAIVINDDRILDLEKLQVCTETGLERSMPIGELIQALAQNLATSRWIYRRFTLPVLPLRDLLLHLLRRFHKGRVTVNANNQAEVPPNAFYNQQFHPYQAELVLRLVKRMDQIREQIACLAEIYLKALQRTPVATFLPPGSDNGGLMRFPVAFPERHRESILRLARKRKLYLKVLWDHPLAEKHELARFPNAVWAAQNVVMLPLYSGLSPKSAELLAQSVIEIERNASAM